MKKNKNNKFKEILKHLKRPLMILSIVFNILFTLLIVIGCVNNKKSSRVQSVNAETQQRVLTLSGTRWKFNDSIATGICKVDGEYTTFSLDRGSGDNINYTLEIDFNTDGSNWNFNALTFLNWYWNPSTSQNSGGISYRYNGGGEYHEEKAYFRDTGWVNEDYQYFETITITGNDEVLQNETIINWFYANATFLSNKSFKFTINKNFNYNAHFGSTLESNFVTKFWSGTSGMGTLTYDFPLFISNGEIFNRIELYFISGYGTRYVTSSRSTEPLTNDNESTCYYLNMLYKNTQTNTSRLVNRRANVYVDDDGTPQNALCPGSLWENNEYQVLYFQTDLSEVQKNNVAQFNNYDVYNGFEGINEDVGLSNVFTLLGGAFTSLISLFKIELLPGISIGLLFFMPLIVGIILLIIWLVKR